MKKLILAVMALCLLPVYIQAQVPAPSEQRMAEYEVLEKEMAKLRSVERQQQSMADVRKTISSIQKIEERLYTEYADVTQWHLYQKQQEIQSLIAQTPRLPYVSFNSLPVENLTKMQENPELLKDFLMQYPDNMANIPTQILFDLLHNSIRMEEYFLNFLVYLRTYNYYPACAEHLPLDKNDVVFFEAAVEHNWHDRVMATAAKDCFAYAKKQNKEELTRLTLEQFKRLNTK